MPLSTRVSRTVLEQKVKVSTSTIVRKNSYTSMKYVQLQEKGAEVLLGPHI